VISIILTTYNRPDALQAVLAGLVSQRDTGFEVVVADDGSTAETRRIVEGYDGKLPITHVWQEDLGFRAASIRNKAIHQCRGEYVVFLDGDCIPRPDFVLRHAVLSEPGYFVAGNRVLIGKAATEGYLANMVEMHNWSFHEYRQAARRGDFDRLYALRQLPGQSWRRHVSQSWKGVRTCNLGVWKKDLLTVNGFDETYTGWGHEDADLAIRLLRAGIKRKDGRFATTVLHLWHAESDRSKLKENEQRLSDLLSSNKIEAAHGLRECGDSPLAAQTGR